MSTESGRVRYKYLPAVRNLDELRRANLVALTKAQAKAVIGAYAPLVPVEFGHEATAYVMWSGDRVLIHLPSIRLSQADIAAGDLQARLSLGVTLHELAHVLAGPTADHGPAFLDALDRLLEDSLKGRLQQIIESVAGEGEEDEADASDAETLRGAECTTGPLPRHGDPWGCLLRRAPGEPGAR